MGIKNLVIKQIKYKSKGDDEDVFRVRWMSEVSVLDFLRPLLIKSTYVNHRI